VLSCRSDDGVGLPAWRVVSSDAVNVRGPGGRRPEPLVLGGRRRL